MEKEVIFTSKKQFLIEVLKDFYAEKALSKIKKTFLKYLY